MKTIKTKALVLDFDNCIALDERTRRGSEDIKSAAWHAVFTECEPTMLDAALAEINRAIVGGQGDRTDVVRYIIKHCTIPYKDIKEEVKHRCERFHMTVRDGIEKLEISPHVPEILSLIKKQMPLFVCTAQPSKAAREYLAALGLEMFFSDVHGTPGTKIAHLRRIGADLDIAPREILFVDDQPSGWSAAQETGVRFAGIHTARNTLWHEAPQPFPIIHSLSELPDLL